MLWSTEQLALTQWEGSIVVSLKIWQLNSIVSHIRKSHTCPWFWALVYISHRECNILITRWGRVRSGYHGHRHNISITLSSYALLLPGIFFLVYKWYFKTDEQNGTCINSCKKAVVRKFTINRLSILVSWSSPSSRGFFLGLCSFSKYLWGKFPHRLLLARLRLFAHFWKWKVRLNPDL